MQRHGQAQQPQKPAAPAQSPKPATEESTAEVTRTEYTVLECVAGEWLVFLLSVEGDRVVGKERAWYGKKDDKRLIPATHDRMIGVNNLTRAILRDRQS